MKRNQGATIFTRKALAIVAVCGIGLIAQPIFARDHAKTLGYTLTSDPALANVKATDLFLRQDNNGHKYLYVAFANNTLAVLNVTNPAEITETRHLAFAMSPQIAHIEPLNARFTVVTNVPSPDHNLAVLDASDPATPEIAKEFRNADCYTIDSGSQTLYVVCNGELSIMQFDRPITRDAEIFEQNYEAR